MQRGAQPWFYYLLLLPQYEFVAVVVFPIAAVVDMLAQFSSGFEAANYPLGGEVGRTSLHAGFFLFWAVHDAGSALLGW